MRTEWEFRINESITMCSYMHQTYLFIIKTSTMKAYYFKHTAGYTLAAVYAMDEVTAWSLLPNQHSWCNASRSNCTLKSVVQGTEWDRICVS